MSNAPPSFETKPDRFKTDIRVANSVASMPGGHNLAANTRTGMKVSCPITVRIKLSPKANQWSSMPKSRLVWVTSSSVVKPSKEDKIVVHAKICLKGTVFKNL